MTSQDHQHYPPKQQKQKIKMKYQDPANLLDHKHSIKYPIQPMLRNLPALYRKYFGKQVLIVTKTSDLTRALNLSKYLISAVILSSFLHRSLVKSKGSKVICLQNVRIMPFQIKKTIMASQGAVKVSNSISEESFFQLTRFSMRDIKELLFSWIYQNQVRFDHHSFASLQRLEKLTLATLKDHQTQNHINRCISDDYEASNLIHMIENVVKLPRLKRLYLDFYGLELSADLVLNLALLIADSKIDSWYLDLIMPFQNVEILKPILEKVHTLGIFINGFYYLSYKIESIQKQNKKKKILCLYFKTPDDFQVNLYSILRHCKSLQNLVLGSYYPKPIYKEEDQSSQWAQNLHSVVLLNRFDKDKLEKDIFICDLLKKVQKKSRNIKILKVINSKNWTVYQRNLKHTDFENYPLICDQLMGIKTLEKVQVSLQTIDSKYLQKLMFSAQNLTVLKLKLSHPNFTNYWDDDLPFAQFRNLKVLKIAFHGVSHEGLWGDNLAHQILEMKDLEVLSIKTQNEWKMLFAKLCIFLNNIVMLPKLRVLKLNTQIIESIENRHNYQNAQFLLDPTTRNLTWGLFHALLIMIYAQRSLEFCEIQTVHSFPNKRIFYQRYPPYL